MGKLLLVGFLAVAAPFAVFAKDAPEWSQTLRFDGSFQREWTLAAGSAFELSIRIDEPSALPPNARIGVAWTGPAIPQPEFEGERNDPGVAATADWQKTLHALDPDVYLVYRTPLAGEYALRLETVTDRPQPLGEIPHDTGLAPLATPLPTRTPPVQDVALTVEMRPLERLSAGDTVIEAEPNNAPEQAIDLPFRSGDEDQIVYVTGGADDIEYYNNTSSGQTPDDWYRIAYKGSQPKFVSANLQIVEPVVSARIRFYRQGRPSAEELRDRDVPNPYDFANRNPVPYIHPPAVVIPGPLPVYTYEEGRAINERAHQQDRSFRTFITRKVMPGETYYLRVEANQPAYEIEVRLFDPAPYDDPAAAVRQGIRYHASEIDAWLIHRPRNVALHRRVRDATALFGENCMSCHTQSGVWGLADAFRNGYGAPAGVEQSFRRLANTMYESLRLTNELEDAAVNTSVAPNDLGDGPAGTRVAGRNIVLHERTHRSKKLHRHWQQRTANYVLQTADPEGINAAGRGSNFGPNVVFKFGAEILERAWRDTGDPRYFFGLEEKARKVVATGNDDIKVTDDLGHRIEFFYRLWPDDYIETVRKLTHSPERIDAARKLQQDFEAQVAVDMERLLALQREDGGWGFDPGGRENESDAWRRSEDYSYPAPTAVSLIALQSAGRAADDPVVQRGVRWLLRNQYPYGLWNAAAATGFVTSAYAIRALSMLHANDVPEVEPPAFDESAGLPRAVSAIRQIQTRSDRRHARSLFAAVQSRSPQIRYHGLVGLGAALVPEAAPVLAAHLNDPVKSCREAAFWSLRQLLLDDIGWEEVHRAFAEGDDRTRQSAMHALITRAYLRGAGSTADLADLVATLTAGMVDPHPGVRAYAFKTAWHWWVWNPEIREPLNRAWLDALTRAEPEAQVEMAFRYSTISLFVVNGQVNNITSAEFLKQQYGELADFYAALAAWREDAPREKRRLVDRRLTAMAASHYMERANQQSPGQFAYSTPGASELFGKAVLAVYADDKGAGVPWRSIAIEGARNIAHEPLQAILLDLLFNGERDVVAAAARGLSNAGELLLPAVPERLNPMLEAMRAYLASGRDEDADAVANFLAGVRWDFKGLSREEEAAFFELLLGAVGAPTVGAPRAAAPPNPPPALLGRPAPTPAPTAGIDVSARQAVLIARILGQNQALHRREAFEHLSTNPRLWLDSTAWMTAYRQDGPTLEEALEGATEAEDLEIAQLTYGRTTEQAIPGGIAGKNSALFWEDSKLDARLAFALDVAEAGNYELTAAFLYGPAHGIVEIALNDEPILNEFDGYRKNFASTGPQSLGVFSLAAGENRLSVRILGSNPETEPEFKFGIDYVKLTPREDRDDRFVKDESGVDVIDPIVQAKEKVIAMFVRWFDRAAPREARNVASRLAGSRTLRRNPEVLRAIAAFVEQEPVAAYRTRLENIVENDDETYRKALSRLIRKQGGTGSASAARPLTAADEFLDDMFYFRDYVFVEMNKIDKQDNRACISCHGVPGRVPTLYLHAPDAAGYIAPQELLANYRRMQERVDLDAPERSLFLRKPLNIQTGQEEGHQGGLRYREDDPGFQVIRSWVSRQAELQRPGK